jgi:hypothetical protein
MTPITPYMHAVNAISRLRASRGACFSSGVSKSPILMSVSTASPVPVRWRCIWRLLVPDRNIAIEGSEQQSSAGAVMARLLLPAEFAAPLRLAL